MTGGRPYVATPEALRELIDSGVTDPEEMADVLKIHVDSVRRGLRNAGITERRKRAEPLTQEVIARAQQMRDEGMPWPWISEDLGVNADRFVKARLVELRPEADREWWSVWGSIMRDEALLELHRQIAPNTRKWSRSRVA